MAPKTSKDINTVPCKVCGAVIRYKADVPRHTRLHLTDKEAMMYKCPFEGCQYQNLQKSNLNTHISTHTGEKPHACPDCEFRTADPGSLTRHRKRVHAYVPKNNSAKAKSVGTKQSRRHAPYKRQASEESLSAFSSSSFEQLPEELLDLSEVLASLPPACESLNATCEVPRDNSYSYTWDKDLFHPEESSALLKLESATPLTPNPVPYHIFPAANVGAQLELASETPFDSLDFFLAQFSMSFIETATQFDCPTISPADTYITHPQTSSPVPEPSWVADLATIELPVPPPCVSDIMDFDCYGSCSHVFFDDSPISFSSSPSPSPSVFSFSDSSSPCSSYSSPSPCDFSFDSPPSGFMPQDTFDFAFPDPILVC